MQEAGNQVKLEPGLFEEAWKVIVQVHGIPLLFHLCRYLSVSRKRQRWVEWIKTQAQLYVVLQMKPQNTNRLKREGWKKIFHENSNQKRAGMTIVISDKIDIES